MNMPLSHDGFAIYMPIYTRKDEWELKRTLAWERVRLTHVSETLRNRGLDLVTDIRGVFQGRDFGIQRPGRFLPFTLPRTGDEDSPKSLPRLSLASVDDSVIIESKLEDETDNISMLLNELRDESSARDEDYFKVLNFYYIETIFSDFPPRGLEGDGKLER
jgi:hypothetical protein